MKLLTAAAVLLLSTGLALAQAPAPTSPSVAPVVPKAQTSPPAADAAKGTPTKKGTTPKSERSPESIACSAEADQKNLHGKERKNFRKTCMAAARKTKAPATKN